MVYIPVCDFDGHFWPKKKHLFYFAVGSGNDYSRYRRRFCTFHCATVEEYLAEHEVITGNGTVGTYNVHLPDCFSCGQPALEGRRQVFITGYPTNDERKDYWGKLCDSHELPEYMRDYIAP